MQRNYIAFQCNRDNAVHFPHFFCFLCKWESCSFTDMVLAYILCQWQNIINSHAGRDLRKDRLYQIGTGSQVCLLGLFKSQGNNFSLTFCTLEISIHQTQSAVSNCLYTV